MRWTQLRCLTLLVTMGGALAGCSQPQAGQDAPAATPAAALQVSRENRSMLDDGEQIRLERSGCGFVCPAYRLSLYADGTVRFTGRAHTGVIGERSGQIDAASLKSLTDKLTAALPAVAGRYVPGDKSCGQMMTDQATMKLAVRTGDGVVDSTRYGGCMGAPEKLAELEDLVDAATHSQQWVSRNPTS